jgi:amino-acid N-acetyltransferase
MEMRAHALGPANGEQYSQLIRQSGLPVAGLLDETECFEFYDDKDVIVGFAGLQRAGVDALLRSLIVVPERRKAGFGSAIVEWTTGLAARDGISQLFLLTTTAQPFFIKCGFQTIDRASVPELIGGLSEFSESCCSSAHVMRRNLTRDI